MISVFKRNLLKAGIIGLSLSVSPVLATQTSSVYTQQYIENSSGYYGSAFTGQHQVDDLYANPSLSPYPLNKTMWLNFANQPSNPYAREWLEIGGAKGYTASSINLTNPQQNEQSYYEGHYFTYQTFDSQGYKLYHEGRIQLSSSIPSGSHRYKLQRNFSNNNQWCSYVDNTNAYCITLAGANNYNSALQLVIGIESQDTTHDFSNGTTASDIWVYPSNTSGFQILSQNMIRADNNNRGWYSQWFPTQNNTNGIGFYK